MSADDSQDGYGFAPRGKPSRKKIGRRTAVPAGPPPSERSRYPHPSMLSDDYAPHARKPAWVWLLIGVLLGSGGTLMTASFWFPEGGNRQIATLETSTDGQTPPPQETAKSEEASLENALEAQTAEDASARPDAPAAQTPKTEVVSIEATARNADDAPSEPEATDTAVSEPVTPEYASPERARTDELPETATTVETLLPDVTDDAIDDIEQQTAETDPTETLSDPEAALSALVSDTVPAPTLSQPPSQDEAAPPPLPAAPSLASSSEPSAEPTAATAAATVDPPARPADASARSEDAAPAGDLQRAELPPRIRQALQRTDAGQEAATAGNGQRLYRVQLAAVDNEAAARIYWREVNARLPGVFTNVEPIFNQRVVDERLFLRIWVGAFDNRGDADGYCGWLKQQGQDCFVTRVDNL